MAGQDSSTGSLSEFETLHSQLLIGCSSRSPVLKETLESSLDLQDYRLHFEALVEDLLVWIGKNRHRIDCLILSQDDDLPTLLENLQARDILLPTLIVRLEVGLTQPDNWDKVPLSRYHNAIAYITQSDLPQVEQFIHQAIEQFLHLPYNQAPEDAEISTLEDTRSFLLSLQQQRLAEKLKERLGYLGVYYKRNPDNFLRHLSPAERANTLEELRTYYRVIILSYFSKDTSLLNQQIDDFVNIAFFADVSVSKIVEIHMELMEHFSKQLKLEGRSEEILLDYRLTLIDVIAHLCEMYRRSVPREA